MVIPAGEIQFNRASVNVNLPHTCTIIRQQQTGETPYEEPIYEWVTLETGVSCEFIQPGSAGGSASAVRTDDRRTVFVYEYRLKLPAGTDINEDDLIDDVVNQLGEPMNLARMRITAVWKWTTETVCVLEKVR